MSKLELSPALLPVIDDIEIANVGALLAQRSRSNANKVFLRFADDSYTFAQMNALANRVARGFEALGVRASDKVSVLLPNCGETIIVWMALAKLGAVMVPINSEYKGEALRRLIENVGSKVAVAHQDLGATAEVLGDVPTLEHTVWVGDRSDRRISFHELLDYPDGDICVEVSPNAPLMFLFTSGSTGMAKPVEISHAFALHTAGELIHHVGYGPDDVMYTPFPLFHGDATLLSVLPALSAGATVAVAPKFSASGFLHDIRKYGATVMTAMGTVVTYLLNQPERPDDSDNTLRIAIAGATPESVPEFERRYGLQLVDVYGSTESCLIAFNSALPHEPGMGGIVCEHHEVQIIDNYGRAVEAGTVGEITTRPRVAHAHMSGYYGNSEETTKAWRGLWYNTGDLGTIDESGVLRFAGRIKDVIRRRGENIPAVEVEEAFCAHPNVIMAAAIAVPSDIVEDDLKVVVEVAEPAAADVNEIIRFVGDRLPTHMVPRYLEFVSDLPKTPTGKTNKVMLRELWATDDTIDLGAQTRR